MGARATTAVGSETRVREGVLVTREKIIQFARDAGVSPVNDQQIKFEGPMWLCLERFAALAPAAERESCIEDCKKIAEYMEGDFYNGCVDCMDAISKRGRA